MPEVHKAVNDTACPNARGDAPDAYIHGLRMGGYGLCWFSNGMASIIKTDGNTKVFSKYDGEKKGLT